MPTCNGARHLREALAGILAQADVPFDLVVSDDRSDDETLAIIGELAGDRARVSVNSERLGLAGNWNRCVSLSQTDRVAIFHQDDVMRPGHLAAHVRAFEADARLGLVASAVDMIDDLGRVIPASVVERGGCGDRDRTFEPGAFLAELAVANPLRCSAVSLLKATHAEVGWFDPSFRYVVDWDYWLRVARAHPVAWLAKPTVAMRWHGSSETHRFKTGTADLDETARLLERFYRVEGSRLSEAPRLRRQADRRLARAFLNRAYDASKSKNPGLARECLARAIRLSPAIILAMIAADPRLAARMAALVLPAPRREI
jgi:glycosyltransferase involved in cell wall biosynthesis